MSFGKYIQQAGQRVGTAKAFSDFLTLAVCAFSMQEKEDLFNQTSKGYQADEMKAFAHALNDLVEEMDNMGTGLKDCLGDYFMEFASNDSAGQFFTPEEVCDLMVNLTDNYYIGKAICDPCCGSGRLFLATARIKRNMFYYGVDIDIRCCYMTLINMCLNNMWGVITHGNSLTNEVWRKWEVRPHPINKIPFIHEIEITAEETKPVQVKIKPKNKPIPGLSKQMELLFAEIDLM